MLLFSSRGGQAITVELSRAVLRHAREEVPPSTQAAFDASTSEGRAHMIADCIEGAIITPTGAHWAGIVDWMMLSAFLRRRVLVMSAHKAVRRNGNEEAKTVLSRTREYPDLPLMRVVDSTNAPIYIAHLQSADGRAKHYMAVGVLNNASEARVVEILEADELREDDAHVTTLVWLCFKDSVVFQCAAA